MNKGVMKNFALLFFALLLFAFFTMALLGCGQGKLETKDIDGTWRFDEDSYIQSSPDLKKHASDPMMRKMVASMIEKVSIKINAEKKTITMGTEGSDSPIGSSSFEVVEATPSTIKLRVNGKSSADMTFAKIDADTFAMQSSSGEDAIKIKRAK